MEQYYPLLWVAFFLLLVAAGLLLLALSYFRKPRPTQRLPYITIPILTESERHFFSVLEGCVHKNCYILAQVRLANLVAVEAGTENFRGRFNAIAMKCVDFVIIDQRTMAPLLVVELDDRSHERTDRKARDRFVDQVLLSVGIPILHYPVLPSYNKSKLVQIITVKIIK